MPIHYARFENNITADPDDYAAMVRVGWASRPPARADGDDLVQDIVDQGSTVNKPDILAVTAALPAVGGTAVSAVSDGKALLTEQWHPAVAHGHPSRVERIGMVSPDSCGVPRFLSPDSSIGMVSPDSRFLPRIPPPIPRFRYGVPRFPPRRENRYGVPRFPDSRPPIPCPPIPPIPAIPDSRLVSTQRRHASI